MAGAVSWPLVQPMRGCGHDKHPAVAAFVDGVIAGAIGAIAGAVIVLGRRSIIDLPTLLSTSSALSAASGKPGALTLAEYRSGGATS